MAKSPLRALALVLVVVLATAAGAQDSATTPPVPAAPDAATPAPAATTTVDYDAWEKVASRAEQALENGRASDQALQTLRGELVNWRDTFTRARADNQVRISTLQTQIAALGPAPGDGAPPEPADVAAQRQKLTDQLNQAQAPVKTAEVALARATSLIDQTDSILRNRQADLLLTLGPAPINPALWPKAVQDLGQTLSLAWSGVTNAYGTDTQRAELRQNAPVALVLAVLALVLILRGRTWATRAGARISRGASGAAEGVWGFVISLAQFAAPLAGVYALVEAMNAAGFLGLRAQVLADGLPLLGLTYLAGRWLGARMFGLTDAHWHALSLPPAARAEGRFHAGMLGLVFGLDRVLTQIAAYESYADATTGVLRLPLLIVAGIGLVRIGGLLRRHARAEGKDGESGGEPEADAGAGFMARTLGLLGLALMLVGVTGPVAAAVGYVTLAAAMLFPTVLTLAVVATLLALHFLFVDLYAVAFGAEESRASEALVPVLATFTAGILAVPVLALIWGARTTDLTDLWARAQQGVTIGGTTISPSNLATFAVVFALGVLITRLIQGTLRTTVLPRTRLDPGGQNAVNSGVGYVGIFLAALIAIPAAGIDLSSVAIVAGALSVGIGFGLQNIISNFVAGVILLIERPIAEGDWIEVGGQQGFVRDIAVRSTRIETFDRTDVIVPNSDLISGVVTNYTRGNTIGRVIVAVGVAYGTDTKKVEAILMDVAKAHPLVAVNPPPSVFFMEFGADSLNFEIRAILKDVNFKLSVKSQMNHEIARRFAEEGIEIPFAQRDIWLRNPEALAGGAGQAGKKGERDA